MPIYMPLQKLQNKIRRCLNEPQYIHIAVRNAEAGLVEIGSVKPTSFSIHPPVIVTAVRMHLETRTLNKAHTYAKAADVARFLLLNKCHILAK